MITERTTAWLGVCLLTAAAGLRDAPRLPRPAREVLADVANDGMNESVQGLATNNYYEGLLAGGSTAHASGLARWFAPPRVDFDCGQTVHDVHATQQSTGFLAYELKPGIDVLHHGVHLRTNRRGLRGPEVEREKPRGVFRIAVCGGSNSMGSGVEYERSMIPLLEARLNREVSPRTGRRYECVNFSCNGYYLPHQVCVVEQKVPAFAPDLVLVFTTLHDRGYPVHRRLAQRTLGRLDLYFDFLKSAAMDMQGIADLDALIRRWGSRKDWIVDQLFRRLAETSLANNLATAVVALRVDVRKLHPTLEHLAASAESAGLPVLCVFNSFDRTSPCDIYQDSQDLHPTAKGHALLADELFGALRSHPRLAPLFEPFPTEPSQ